MTVTCQELASLFNYDKGSGILTWKKTCRAAGTFYHGYLKVSISRKRYYVHRVAWAVATGAWPKGTIDHIDLNRANNKFDNLRDVSHSLNMRNCHARVTNKCGLKGVSPKGKRFRAQISVGGKSRVVGVYDTPEEAHEAYIRVASATFGEYARAA